MQKNTSAGLASSIRNTTVSDLPRVFFVFHIMRGFFIYLFLYRFYTPLLFLLLAVPGYWDLGLVDWKW
jgi:hypothetical protein